ncbi:MAG: hypothetical protein QM682_02125 [Paracoccus sp. (in: a-proteobacteria)]|uniref:hypothetical protein n=1 Tax=Paracoccus sp. TaxID=267 RepID=UPI0039E66F8C
MLAQVLDGSLRTATAAHVLAYADRRLEIRWKASHCEVPKSVIQLQVNDSVK